MKKNIYLALVLILGISFCSCKGKTNNNESENNESSSISILSEEVENNSEETSTEEPPKPILGEEVELEKVTLFDQKIQIYTAENLPREYKKADFDNDGLMNRDEISIGTNMYKLDTDGDGISDYEENRSKKTDPTKWSTRDDGISDLEYMIINDSEFKEEYTQPNANGFRIYLSKPEDRLWMITKTYTDVFNDLETISEAFQIKCFSGKIAIDCSKYVDDVANSIAVYKDVNGKATKVECKICENKLVEFNLNENDIFVVVYEEK